MREILSLKMLMMLIHGVSAGIPLLLIGSTLSGMLTENGMSMGEIGLFALAKTPYAFKPVWSPLLDRFNLGFLHRRKAWIFTFQVLLALTIAPLGYLVTAGVNPLAIGVLCLFIGFFSASQDIVIDAYRRELLEDRELGLGSSTYVAGYRLAILFSTAGALVLAQFYGWGASYLLMGLTLLACSFTTFFAPDPLLNEAAPASIKEAVIGPFVDFFKKDSAWLILLFILFYKIGDQMASNFTLPFYLQLGFTKVEIAAITKVFGIGATIGGGFLGGVLMLRLGLFRSLLSFGVLQMISTFGFSLLDFYGKNLSLLTGVIFFENLAAGMGTAAYIAYMASMTNKKYTATQYALLTSFMALPMSVLAAPTGYLVEALGWFYFFLFCTLIALPGLLMMLKLGPSQSEA